MLFIDNTYISSFEELKAIIESYANDKSSKRQDEFRTEFVETFEDKTNTGLAAFVESLQTEEAKEYAKQLVELNLRWNSLSFSEQYNALVTYFHITPNIIDTMKYIEIQKLDIQDEEDKIKVSIDVKVTIPVNENIQFAIKLFDKNGRQLHHLLTEKKSLAVFSNQILHFDLQSSIDTNADKIEIILNHEVIDTRFIGKILPFSVDGVEFKMIRVEGGKFMMGSKCGNDNEKPIHEVQLSDFYLAETQVTQSLWHAVMNENPSVFNRGGDYPVERVSWLMCKDFIKKLNQILKDQLNGKYFDFPSEAQWEYAAKGGKNKEKYQYSGSDTILDVAWYMSNSDNTTHKVKRKSPNSLGIFDMSGNVEEWCKDKFDAKFYSTDKANKKNPICNEEILPSYVARGGGWWNTGAVMGVSHRFYHSPDHYMGSLGLRLALCVK